MFGVIKVRPTRMRPIEIIEEDAITSFIKNIIAVFIGAMAVAALILVIWGIWETLAQLGMFVCLATDTLHGNSYSPYTDSVPNKGIAVLVAITFLFITGLICAMAIMLVGTLYLVGASVLSAFIKEEKIA